MEQYPGLHKLHLIHAVLLGWIFVIKRIQEKGYQHVAIKIYINQENPPYILSDCLCLLCLCLF